MCKRDIAGFLGSGRRRDRRERRILLQVFVVLLLLTLMPLTGFAEDLRLSTSVQIMPITGTNLTDADPIMEAMVAEVQRTEGFVIVQTPGMTSRMVNPTDASPEAEYSISGALVEELGDTLFQISLYRLSDSSLLLSEEMVYVDLEEALDLVPILVWSLLGNIPSKSMPIDRNWRTHWLYLGLVTGGTISYDELQGYYDPKPPDMEDTEMKGDGLGLSPTGALTLMVPFLNIPLRGDPKVYLELQTEVRFGWEWAGYSYHDENEYVVDGVPLKNSNANDKNGVWTDEFSFYSFTFPLLLKVEFSYGPLMLAPYGGVYFYLPIGDAESKTNRTAGNLLDDNRNDDGTPKDPAMVRENGVLAVSVDGIPLGISAGFYMGMKMGPGALVLDLRYSKDLSPLTFKNKDDKKILGDGLYLSVDRQKFSLMIGYEIGLFKHNREMEVNIE